jgi:DNA-binding NtrC family response regulator
MNTKQILVVGRNQDTMQKVLQLINQHENWTGKGSITDAGATEMFMNGTFDLVLLGGGVEVESGIQLRKTFTEHNADIYVIQHFGSVNTLVSDIEAAFKTEGHLI